MYWYSYTSCRSVCLNKREIFTMYFLTKVYSQFMIVVQLYKEIIFYIYVYVVHCISIDLRFVHIAWCLTNLYCCYYLQNFVFIAIKHFCLVEYLLCWWAISVFPFLSALSFSRSHYFLSFSHKHKMKHLIR